MENKNSNRHKTKRIPWNIIVQIFFVLVFFYLLSWLINSLSFTGRNGIDTQASQSISSLELFDNFGFKVFDTKWNESTWAEVGSGSTIYQLDGVLKIARDVKGFGGLTAHRRKWYLSQINYAEIRLMLNSSIQTQAGEIGIEIFTVVDGNRWFVRCGILGGKDQKEASIHCSTTDGFSTTGKKVVYDTWHQVRIEVDSPAAEITFFVDNQYVGIYSFQDKSLIKNGEYSFILDGSSSSDGHLEGSFDIVQIKNK